MTSRDVSGAQKARACENETRDAADRVDARGECFFYAMTRTEAFGMNTNVYFDLFAP